MKHISWKIRVTIWYTSFVVIIAAFSMLLITRYAGRMFTERYEEDLRDSIDDFMDEMKIEEGEVIPGDNGYYENDIVFSVYNSKGELIAGYVPKYFPQDTVLKNYQSQTMEYEDRQWRTYDMRMEAEDGEFYWVRAIMYTTRNAAIERTVLILQLAVLPLLVLLAAVGGYFITKRAFAPIDQMRGTADRIAKGGDIRERVPEVKTSGELRRLAETLNGMLDTIENMIEEEKQFTADASHELRTPIAVVLAQSEYGVMDDATDEERKEALEIILQQGNKMSTLVSQLLAMSRSEYASRTAVYEEVMLSQTAETVAGELVQKAKEKEIEIITDICPELTIYAEQMGVTRIFVNLIENAIQYGKNGGFIRVEIKKENGKAVCKISDNGIGIKEEHLPNIFKRFYRADKARTAGKEVHAGLGLSMVKILVKNYGGKIRVSSVYGEGTTFTMHFPLYEKDNIR